MAEYKKHNSKYWGAKDDIVPELQDKVTNYYKHLIDQGYMRRFRRSFAQYNGLGLDGRSDQLTETGTQGELTKISVNHYGNLIKGVLTLVTSQRPAWDVRPINTDYQSQAQAILGENILDFYEREKRVGRLLKEAVEKSLVWGEGFITLAWDTTLGEVYEASPDQEAIMSGDIKFSCKNPLDVVRDVFTSDREHSWKIVRTFVNRFDLCAQYYEHEDAIKDVEFNTTNTEDEGSYFWFQDTDTSDLVPVWEFYHKKSAAMPEGRYVKFCGDAKLIDTTLPYDNIPVYRVSDRNLEGTCLGYSSAFDLLALQDASDDLLSAVISNNIACANQIMLIPKGANINHQQLGEGLSIIEYDTTEGKIEPVSLVNSSNETYALIDRLQSLMQMISSINEVVRGEPGANLRSGNALALVAAQALQFNSGLQGSYVQIQEDVGTAIIHMLQTFAQAPRYIAIVGKYNRSLMKEFKADDIERVSRVFCDIANPLTKSTSGKLEIADNLMQAGLIKNPEDYVTMIETGNLEDLTESSIHENLLIRSENEKLQNGQNVSALMIDNHRLHILHHKAVLNNPEARDNPDIVQVTLAHIQDHVEQWATINPNLGAALADQPAPMPAGPSQQAGPPQPSGGPGGPPPVPQPEGMPQPASEAPQPGLPELPEGATPETQLAYKQIINQGNQ